MQCAANGHVDILKLLIGYNADVAARDRCRQPQHARDETSSCEPHSPQYSRGKTVFTLALEKNRKLAREREIHDGHARVVAYLKSIKAPQ
jgi:hypothetical protein